MATASDAVQECLQQLEDWRQQATHLQGMAEAMSMRLAEELTMATREGAVEWGRTLPFDIRDRYVSARVIATEIGGAWVYVFWYPSARVCFRSPAALHTGPVINDLMQAITEHFAATGRERYLTRAHWDVAETEEATT